MINIYKQNIIYKDNDNLNIENKNKVSMMTIKMTARLWISNNDDNDIEVTITKKL